VPQIELARFARAFFDLGYGVDPEDVAERFGVSRAQASRALVDLMATRDIPA
jgi:predicted RNA-binding protein (virulence factor B family)